MCYGGRGLRAEDDGCGGERRGKAQKNLTLNAAPVDVADYLRRRLFGSDTSIIMTSATLATQFARAAQKAGTALDYFAKRVGAEEAIKLQAGSPFDYERQMKVFVVNKIPEPRDPGH